ncbi:class I SAM-dependent methyltransferase [Planococcus versutus]|uniref:Ubiquinone biosynthesis methyltransferase UbiE n=1 Tax=Planococcus versutus TaxID=1302659 RepID=A0A1B1RX37_9BACL|nr:class I SAM-dependent methyltransferase [Planococcus versutus]ANU25494.1 ubiquinone biosynthesis methyltransferase UbiE [Planococcus versutus]
MKKQVIEVFNELASIYRETDDAKNLYNTQYERPAMLQQIPLDLSGVQLLDAGCSAGWYSEQLDNRGADVTSVDISPEMVKYTKKLLGDDAKVLNLDLEQALPFNDNSFDWIVSSLTLHYLEDWRLVFKEFHRVLKPGGRFLMSIHHPLTDLKLLDDIDYFSTELIVDSWHKEGKVYSVPFFRRSLSEIFDRLHPYFSIERVIEPKPTERFNSLEPEKYNKLMQSPNFLILEVVKDL